MKTPATRLGFSSKKKRDPRQLEAVVQGSAYDAAGGSMRERRRIADAVGTGINVGDRVSAQIVVEIFNPDCPFYRKAVFYASADGPAGPRRRT